VHGEVKIKLQNLRKFFTTRRNIRNFDVLLTVHLSIFISVINQIIAQSFCFTIRLYHASCLNFTTFCSYLRNCILVILDHSLVSVWWYQRLCNAILTSWWWAHMLETCRGMKKTYCKKKFCGSSRLITEVILVLRVKDSTVLIAGQRTYRKKSCWKGLFSFAW